MNWTIWRDGLSQYKTPEDTSGRNGRAQQFLVQTNDAAQADLRSLRAA